MHLRSILWGGFILIVTAMVGVAAVQVGIKRWESHKRERLHFVAVPGAPDRAANPRAEVAPAVLMPFVEARRIDFTVPRGKPEQVNQALFATFANNPYELSFSAATVTREEFPSVLAAYQEELIAKAERADLPSSSLRDCLRRIEGETGPPLLPVGAYLAKSGRDEAWIIVGKWEHYISSPAVRDGAAIAHLGHVRVWAFRATDGELLAYATCR